jgi:hypothetical protein
MHAPEDVVGKTALYYEDGVVPHTLRVMVTKSLGNDKYILSEYSDATRFYETTSWFFTVEKDIEQPEESNIELYLETYEKLSKGA